MDGPSQTLHEAAKAYIEHLRTQGKTERTLYTYGKDERAKPTVEKTKRVLRMFLIWAKDTGRIEKLPLPKGTPMSQSVKKGGKKNDEHGNQSASTPAQD